MWYVAQICIGTDARLPGNVVHTMLYIVQSILFNTFVLIYCPQTWCTLSGSIFLHSSTPQFVAALVGVLSCPTRFMLNRLDQTSFDCSKTDCTNIHDNKRASAHEAIGSEFDVPTDACQILTTARS